MTSSPNCDSLISSDTAIPNSVDEGSYFLKITCFNEHLNEAVGKNVLVSAFFALLSAGAPYLTPVLRQLLSLLLPALHQHRAGIELAQNWHRTGAYYTGTNVNRWVKNANISLYQLAMLSGPFKVNEWSIRIPKYINIIFINLSQEFYVLLADVLIVFLVGGSLVLSLADSHRLVSYVGQELICVSDGGFVLENVSSFCVHVLCSNCQKHQT